MRSHVIFRSINKSRDLTSIEYNVRVHIETFTKDLILYGVRFSVLYSFISVLKLFDPSLKIRGPEVVKQAEFIHNQKVHTICSVSCFSNL